MTQAIFASTNVVVSKSYVDGLRQISSERIVIKVLENICSPRESSKSLPITSERFLEVKGSFLARWSEYSIYII